MQEPYGEFEVEFVIDVHVARKGGVLIEAQDMEHARLLVEDMSDAELLEFCDEVDDYADVVEVEITEIRRVL